MALITEPSIVVEPDPFEHSLALELVRVTEVAALAAGPWTGRQDKNAADGAAVFAMRGALRSVDVRGTVAIGEGEKDRAPMLFRGESVGTGRGPVVEVAVDPVEGTALVAAGRPDALSVIAVAPRGSMWSPGPAHYMMKIVVGSEARAAVRPAWLDAPVADVLGAIAKATHRPVHDLTVFVIERPRHAALIADIRAAGARLMLRTDGDVNGAILAAMPGTGVDALMGIGGTPEGVVSACAVRALGGAMLGRLAPQRPEERDALAAAGVDTGLVVTEEDLVRSGDTVFAATGITDGVLLSGVRVAAGLATTESILIEGRSGTIRRIRASHRR